MSTHRDDGYYSDNITDLKAVFDKHRGKGEYDCLVPYSGGKDSSYVLMTCVQHGMRPLAYNFNNHFQTPIGKQNMETVVRSLGTAMVNFAPDWRTARSLCIKGLEKIGDFCWFCNAGSLASSVLRAVKEGIGLVVFGEEAAEYDARFGFGQQFETKFRKLGQEGIPETEFLDQNITEKDMTPYCLPPLAQREGLDVIYLGKYIRWDKEEIISTIKSELGWMEGEVVGAATTYEHIDCKYTGIRDYIKFLKRGFGRHTHLASVKVRQGKITREEALAEAALDGVEPPNLQEFLDDLGLTREQFMDIVARHKKY